MKAVLPVKALVPILFVALALVALPGAAAFRIPSPYDLMRWSTPTLGDPCSIPDQNLADLMQGVARVCETHCLSGRSPQPMCETRNTTITAPGYAGYGYGYGGYGSGYGYGYGYGSPFYRTSQSWLAPTPPGYAAAPLSSSYGGYGYGGYQYPGYGSSYQSPGYYGSYQYPGPLTSYATYGPSGSAYGAYDPSGSYAATSAGIPAGATGWMGSMGAGMG